MALPRPTTVADPPLSREPGRLLPQWLIFAALAVTALLAYVPGLRCPFVFDDVPAIVENGSLRHFATSLVPPVDTTTTGRPVLNFSFALDQAIDGLAPAGCRAFNLLIHLAAALLVYGIVRRTPVRGRQKNNGLAAAVALLWLVHPLQTESVTYIVQRAESLMGFFYLLTLYAFIRGATAPKARGWFVAAFVSCLLGMGTKEVMVSAPVIVLLYDRTFLAGSFRAAWRERRGVYFALAATGLFLAMLVFAAKSRSGTSGFGIGVSWWQYVLTQPRAIVRYVGLTLWPSPLIFDYGTQWATAIGGVAPYGLLVILGIAATMWCARSPAQPARAVGFAGLWFWAILAPSSLVPGSRQTAAEHRVYLALVPLLALLVMTIGPRVRRPRTLLIVLAAAMLMQTWRRNLCYNSARALWSDTVAKNPANPHAQINLANALVADALPDAGQEPGAPRTRREEAIAHLQVAIQLEPGLAEAHNNLANLWAAMPDRSEDAMVEYQRALQLNPTLPEAHNNLGNILNRRERYDEAIAHYEAAVRLRPDYAEAHFNLAVTLLNFPDRARQAEDHAAIATRLRPDLSAPRELLTELKSRQGR